MRKQIIVNENNERYGDLNTEFDKFDSSYKRI